MPSAGEPADVSGDGAGWRSPGAVATSPRTCVSTALTRSMSYLQGGADPRDDERKRSYMHLPDGLAAATVAGDHTDASASGPTEPRYADDR